MKEISTYSRTPILKYIGESGLLRYFANQWFNNVLGNGLKKYSWRFVPKDSSHFRDTIEITAEINHE
ncbi:hypothetical protein LCGC14_2660270 [marine sediment metagenome]|uniref:Uncharacterized protein n=1 Tax=marine sediment metagenome TaxID=412755 RepID=A0A0F8ZS90_9ZZZZ